MSGDVTWVKLMAQSTVLKTYLPLIISVVIANSYTDVGSGFTDPLVLNY